MQTYRVKMNNIPSIGDSYDPDVHKGLRFYHICSDSIAGAVLSAEQQFAGVCESVTVKQLTSPSFQVRDMQEYENYELMSAPGSSNDTIIFRKNCQKINVTLRGGHFSERGTSFWFNLSILDFLKNITHFPNADELTLERLEMLSFEIYSIVKEKHIPAMFNGKMNKHEFSGSNNFK